MRARQPAGRQSCLLVEMPPPPHPCPSITLASGLLPGYSGFPAVFTVPPLGLSHQLGLEKES